MGKQVDWEVMSDDLGLKNVLLKFKSRMLKSFNCVKVGKIKTFYSDKQTVDIEIEGYPKISSVPVSFIFGGNFSIQVPIKEGDDCIVLFCDTDLDNWVEGKGGEPAFSEDLHGLNGAIALVGLTNLNTKISDYITDGIRIKYKGSAIEVKEDGIKIKGNVTVEGDVIADGISLKQHTHLPGTYSNSAGNVNGESGIPKSGV